MKRWLPTVFVLLLLGRASGQEQQGMAHGNYAGTDAVSLNPARLSGQWCWMDVNIIGLDVHARNDHVYVTGRSRSFIGEMRESLRTDDGDRFLFSESLDGGERHAFIQARVKGPAIALSSGRNSVGAHVSTRTLLSLTGVGNDVARFAYNGLGYAPQHGTRFQHDHLRLSAMAFTEIGASYARQLVAHDFNRLSAGITAKYLIGHGAASLAFSSLDYTVQDTARIALHEVSGTYGIALPAMVAGRGFGADIGVSFERTLEEADGHIPHSGCDPLPYKYRVGFSLIDLGGIRFADALAGSFDAGTGDIADYETIQVQGEEGVDSLLASTVSGYQREGAMGVGLPTAASVQLDHRIVDHVYIAAAAFQNLSFGTSTRLRRPNTVSVVPRIEFRRFEAALPITFHEYRPQRPSVGLMVRLNNITIGGDNLLPLVTRAPLYGTDIWFRIKWTVFRSPVCRGKKKPKHRAGDSNAMPCELPE